MSSCQSGMSASSAYALKETYSWKQPRATPMLQSTIQSYTVYISTLVYVQLCFLLYKKEI